MLKRMRPGRPSPAMVVAVIALIVALSGTGYAAITLPRNSVGTRQLKKNAVVGSKIKKNAVTSGKVKDGSLLSSDFKAGQFVVGAPGPQGPGGPQGAKGDKGDTGDTGPSLGRSSTGSCNPSSTTFLDCASTTFSLPVDGRVLLIGTSGWDDNDTGDVVVRGDCRLRVDGTTTVGASPQPGQATNAHNVLYEGTVAITGVSAVLSAGSHTFALQCNEGDGDIFFTESNLSAVLLGAS